VRALLWLLCVHSRSARASTLISVLFFALAHAGQSPGSQSTTQFVRINLVHRIVMSEENPADLRNVSRLCAGIIARVAYGAPLVRRKRRARSWTSAKPHPHRKIRHCPVTLPKMRWQENQCIVDSLQETCVIASASSSSQYHTHPRRLRGDCVSVLRSPLPLIPAAFAPTLKLQLQPGNLHFFAHSLAHIEHCEGCHARSC
jgi:hypothetical protein